MIITKLIVRKLHNVYNYEVNFNEDLTFLYGINGSGKTTILNIVTNIVQGDIYELFAYTFESITLKYKNQENIEKEIVISTVKSKNTYCTFKIRYENITHSFKFDEFPFEKELLYNESVIKNRVYAKYPLLKAIKNEFSYIYLPLNRNEHALLSEKTRNKLGHIETKEFMQNSMKQVEYLIKDKVLKITNEINKLNDNFRNQILTSALNTYKNNFKADYISKQILEIDISEIETIQTSYLNILNNLNLLDAKNKDRYETFFTDYKSAVNRLQSRSMEVHEILNLLIQYNEIDKIRNIVSLAKEMELAKEKEFMPLEIFCKTVNEFLKADTVENKKIFIDDKGDIRFHTLANRDNQGLSIEKLSSGEKQLLIFFATLIFKANKNTQSIFIVDEPELSLHLAWQNIFVEKVMAINNKIQLIFATHSPEIIGPYRNKTSELKKELGD